MSANVLPLRELPATVSNGIDFPLDEPIAADQPRDELFPYADEDVLPIQNPLIIARPQRFANKREIAQIVATGVSKLQESNSALLSYLTLKQWDEIVKSALDQVKEAAEDDFQRFFTKPTVLHGVEVAYRGMATAWEYPEAILNLETEIKRLQEELKAKKKIAELDGSARKLGSRKGLVVTFTK